jgi:acyl carrier protein
MVTQTDIVQWTRAQLAEMLERPVDEISASVRFAQLGIDSALATNLLLALEDWLNIEVDPDTAVDQPTISALSVYICSLLRVEP